MLSRPFPFAYFDVSGTCDAKCPWCERGCRSHNMDTPLLPDLPQFTSSALVEETLQSMLANKIISEDTVIHPYNWGEAFLNPHFPDILRIIKNLGLQCYLSTNGATPLRLKGDDDLSHVLGLRFSLPGFSQQSYDKAHGFSFETIKKRIKSITETVRSHGMKGKIELFFMLYTYNIKEIPLALDFVNQIGANFHIAPATFNNMTLA